MFRNFVFLLILLFFSPVVQAQNDSIFSPVEGMISLSGSFGELRMTHFHGGMDFRTGGVEGLPVRCFKDGFLRRMSRSAWSYGNALYIEHYDGTMSVYAHLQTFRDDLQKLTDSMSYVNRDFEVDLKFAKDEYKFKAGDVIGLSGNTGSSGGPHLHFEIRDVKTNNKLNPQRYFSYDDMLKPIVKAMYIYRLDKSGVVDRIDTVVCASSKPFLNVKKKLSPGYYGLGFWIEDRMENSSNKFGLRKIKLLKGGSELYSYVVDTLDANRTLLINDVKDYELYLKGTKTVYKCFGFYQEKLPGVKIDNYGFFELKDTCGLSLEVEDFVGNVSKLKLSLRANDSSSVGNGAEDSGLLLYDRGNMVKLGNMSIDLPKYSLLSSVRLNYECRYDTLYEVYVYKVADVAIPLANKSRLCFVGEYSSKDVICMLNRKNKLVALATERSEGRLEADLSVINRYAVVRDTLAPKISYVGRCSGGSLLFKVSDDLTGIKHINAYADGEWVLMYYEPKTNTLSSDVNSVALKFAKQFMLELEDSVGNKSCLKLDLKRDEVLLN